MKRISLHPKCETAPIRLDENNRTSGVRLYKLNAVDP
jgi:hypothetical protein